MVTAMSHRTIVKVLGLFIHSAKWAVLLKAELEKLMLLAIVQGGAYVPIIKDYQIPPEYGDKQADAGRDG